MLFRSEILVLKSSIASLIFCLVVQSRCFLLFVFWVFFISGSQKYQLDCFSIRNQDLYDDSGYNLIEKERSLLKVSYTSHKIINA